MKKYLSVLVYCAFALLVASSCMKKCPHDSCQTKMIHAHNGTEYRGMPWYKKQNPRTGELNPELNRDGKKY